MNDASRAVLALTSTLVDGGAPPLKARELWRLLDVVGDPAPLLGRTATELAADVDSTFDGARLAARLDSGLALAVRLDALGEQGIWTLTPFDAEFPPGLRGRLGPSTPPVLYGAGAATTLSADAIGVVAEPDEPSGLEASVAAAAAARGWAMVTGHVVRPTGGDDGGADPEGGPVRIAVLPGALDEVLGRADVRRAVLGGRACLVSPYRPDARTSDGTAAGRTKIVYGLSRITVVVTADDGTGPAVTGALDAIDRGFGPVAVWGADPSEGRATLERAGARTITAIDDLFSSAAPDRSTP